MSDYPEIEECPPEIYLDKVGNGTWHHLEDGAWCIKYIRADLASPAPTPPATGGDRDGFAVWWKTVGAHYDCEGECWDAWQAALATLKPTYTPVETSGYIQHYDAEDTPVYYTDGELSREIEEPFETSGYLQDYPVENDKPAPGITREAVEALRKVYMPDTRDTIQSRLLQIAFCKTWNAAIDAILALFPETP